MTSSFPLSASWFSFRRLESFAVIEAAPKLFSWVVCRVPNRAVGIGSIWLHLRAWVLIGRVGLGEVSGVRPGVSGGRTSRREHEPAGRLGRPVGYGWLGCELSSHCPLRHWRHFNVAACSTITRAKNRTRRRVRHARRTHDARAIAKLECFNININILSARRRSCRRRVAVSAVSSL